MSSRLRPARSRALRVAGTGPMPITSGAQPATAMPRMRARTGRPCARAKAPEVTSSAAAPSVSGELVPAVTEPSASKAGLSSASLSTVVSGRMQPSWRTRPVLPRIGTISASNRPSARAAAALRWLVAAKASCASRPIWCCRARFSAVSPIET